MKQEDAYKMTKLIDRKNKTWPEEFKAETEKILGEKTASFLSIINSDSIDSFLAAADKETSSNILGAEELKQLLHALQKRGITNAVFDPTITRGFDYYTGIVFEVNDTSPKNPRALLVAAVLMIYYQCLVQTKYRLSASVWAMLALKIF